MWRSKNLWISLIYNEIAWSDLKISFQSHIDTFKQPKEKIGVSAQFISRQKLS